MEYQTENDQEVAEMLAWADIKDSKKSGKVLTARAIGLEELSSAGLKTECLKLNFGGVYGYLPKDKIDDYEFKSLQFFIGKYFEFVVEDVFIDKEQTVGTFLANRTKALAISSRKFWRTAKVGQIYESFIRGIDQFQLYLLVEGVSVILHRDEVGYSYYEDLRHEFEIGDSLDVRIMELEQPTDDKKDGVVTVSSKVLARDPWLDITHFQEKMTYLGTIQRVHPVHGLFIELEKGLNVRTNFPSGGMSRVFKAIDEINVRILSIDVVQRRIKAISIVPEKKIGGRTRGVGRQIMGRRTSR